MDESDIRGNTENTSPNDNYYKNSSLKSGRAALTAVSCNTTRQG